MVQRNANRGKHCTAGLTRRSVGMLVQQTTTPVKGCEWSKASASWSEDAGGESMTLVALNWNRHPCKGMGFGRDWLSNGLDLFKAGVE